MMDFAWLSMLDEEQGTIVVFSTDRFDLSWPSAAGDPNYPPRGRDAAVYFQRKLSERGMTSIGSEPVMGECGWHWSVASGKATIDLVLHWAPIGSPRRDCWVIQSKVHIGLFGRLIGGKVQTDELTSLCAVLKSIIESESDLANVRWLTPDEFRSIY
jgi:hypothetical protein